VTPRRSGPDGPARNHEDYVTAPEVERLDKLATLLDSRFQIFGFRFGVDGLLGLIPGVGDAVALALSGYLITEAARAGARKRTLVRMAGNAAIDAAVGSIPVVGDLFDFVFKANKKNIGLLRAEMIRRHDGKLSTIDIKPKNLR
jgi:hypothetical protein